MKTFKFNIYKYTITVTIDKKPYKTAKEIENVFEHYGMDTAVGINTFGTMNIADETEEIKIETPKTVSECVTEYIDSQRCVLSDATIKGYENIRDKHFAGLMSCRMKYIDDGVIQRSFNEEIEKGYNKKTIKGYRSFILKVLAVYRPDLKPEIRVEKENAE